MESLQSEDGEVFVRVRSIFLLIYTGPLILFTNDFW